MNKRSRYQQIETVLSCLLAAALAVFILYLVFSGCGNIAGKVISCIITMLLCGLSLTILYLTRLLLKPRSLWMTAAASAIFICLLFSLILSYPSPV